MTPPRWSRFILRALTRPDFRDVIADDLDEVYAREVQTRGVSGARWWYRFQVVHDPATFAFAAVAIATIALVAVAGSLRRLRSVNAVEALNAE